MYCRPPKCIATAKMYCTRPNVVHHSPCKKPTPNVLHCIAMYCAKCIARYLRCVRVGPQMYCTRPNVLRHTNVLQCIARNVLHPTNVLHQMYCNPNVLHQMYCTKCIAAQMYCNPNVLLILRSPSCYNNKLQYLPFAPQNKLKHPQRPARPELAIDALRENHNFHKHSFVHGHEYTERAQNKCTCLLTSIVIGPQEGYTNTLQTNGQHMCEKGFVSDCLRLHGPRHEVEHNINLLAEGLAKHGLMLLTLVLGLADGCGEQQLHFVNLVFGLAECLGQIQLQLVNLSCGPGRRPWKKTSSFW